jgi:hypothetical protein
VRLYIEIGELRPANKEELAQIAQRIQSLKWTKGSRLIWSILLRYGILACILLDGSNITK